MQMIQRVQASGPASAEAILCTVLNDMVFTTYKILNSIEDPGLRAKLEADLSGHPQNERSGPLAFFYLMQNVCNLEHDQETEVHLALYKCHSVSSIQYQSYTPGYTTASPSQTHKINRAPTKNNDSVTLQECSYDYNCRLL
jgi:hypothetical protein